MIDFLDEWGNFKQKDFYTSKCNSFYILQQQIQCLTWKKMEKKIDTFYRAKKAI